MKQDTKRRRIGAVLLCVAVICLSIVPAFATNNGFSAVPEFGDKVHNYYNLATKIALPLGAVSFAMGAFRCILGTDKAAEGGKKQMIWTAAAVAALFIVPAVVSLGASLGEGHDWGSQHGI